MEDFMHKDDYEHYQNEIGRVCMELGLVKKEICDTIEYRTEMDTSFIYGEVIRLFDYRNHYNPSVVFFNKLEESKTKRTPYSYIYENRYTELPFKTERNTIPFKEPLNEVLDKIKYIVGNAVRQRKELASKLRLEQISEDF